MSSEFQGTTSQSNDEVNKRNDFTYDAEKTE
jgi:hypothetical protein